LHGLEDQLFEWHLTSPNGTAEMLASNRTQCAGLPPMAFLSRIFELLVQCYSAACSDMSRCPWNTSPQTNILFLAGLL